MNAARLYLTLLGLLCVVSVTAQEPEKIAPSPTTDAYMDDGSKIRMTIIQEQLEIMTEYGKLTVPVKHIRRIEFGLRNSPEVIKDVQEAIKLLASDEYKERDKATKFLVATGYRAYPFLKETLLDHLEVKNRLPGILKSIERKEPIEHLKLKKEDVVYAKFKIEGSVIGTDIRGHSVHFGEISLELSKMRKLLMLTAAGEQDVTVDAVKYGSAVDQWLDTGIGTDPSQLLIITGEGQVDLWPQGPGQYMATPKGYTTAGRGGQFQAGALVARIGESGKPFLVGERYEGTPKEGGKVYLHIVPSPWNNASSGSYRVRLKTNVVLSQK